MEHVLALFIDALGCDQLNPVDTPYLHSLARKGGYLPLRPILGYSDAIRATLFTGTYPDRHNYWIMYRFNPKASPYGIYKCVRFLDHLPGSLGRGSKLIASMIVGKPLAYVKGLPDLNTRNIPYGIIQYFDNTARGELHEAGVLPVATMFDVLGENEMMFEYINSSRVNPLKAIERVESNASLILVYLHYLDWAAHRYGLSDKRYKETLRTVDGMSRRLVERAKRLGSLSLVVFSDHGMVEPKHYIDLSDMINCAEHGRDYLLILDSTMIHIWYLNVDRKTKVKKMMEELPCGHILTDEERRELRIRFSHRWYGDDVYLFEPEYQIFPNYISILKAKAMHAYHPDYRHQHGIFACEYEIGKERSMEIPDITATIYKLLDLKPPPTCEGRSLLQ